jgi:LacI family transcriptional regulator
LTLQLIPTVEQILGNKKITAIVAAHDRIALIVYDILRERGVSLPRDISCMGFDDVVRSFEYQLTTYNFMIPEIATIILNFVVHPNQEHFRRQPRSIECEGVIVERKSTGPVKKVH